MWEISASSWFYWMYHDARPSGCQIVCSYLKGKNNYKYMYAVCGRSVRSLPMSDQWMFISKLFWKWWTVDFVRCLLFKNNKKFWESDVFLFSGQILGKHLLSQVRHKELLAITEQSMWQTCTHEPVIRICRQILNLVGSQILVLVS